MKRKCLWLAMLGVCLVILPTRGQASSDQVVPFRLNVSRRVDNNQLVIPKKFLENSTALGSQGAAGDRGNLRTVIAGLAISVSLICLVFLILRKRSRAAQTILLLVSVLGVGYLWGDHASADGPPPAYDVERKWKYFAGEDGQYVEVKITDDGDAIRLLLDRNFESAAYRDLKRSKERARTRAEREAAEKHLKQAMEAQKKRERQNEQPSQTKSNNGSSKSSAEPN